VTTAAPGPRPRQAAAAGPADTPARVTRRRAETRARLVGAGFSVFARRGFGATSIEDVCEAAGYTRGAFYSNFASLDELFYAIHEERAQAVTRQVADALVGDDLPAAIRSIVDALTIDRDWVLVRTDFTLHAARNPDVGRALLAHRVQLQTAIATVLTPVADTASLPATLRRPEDLARAVMAVHDGAMGQLLLDPDVEALRSWLVDLLTTLLD